MRLLGLLFEEGEMGELLFLELFDEEKEYAEMELEKSGREGVNAGVRAGMS